MVAERLGEVLQWEGVGCKGVIWVRIGMVMGVMGKGMGVMGWVGCNAGGGESVIK